MPCIANASCESFKVMDGSLKTTFLQWHQVIKYVLGAKHFLQYSQTGARDDVSSFDIWFMIISMNWGSIKRWQVIPRSCIFEIT